MTFSAYPHYHHEHVTEREAMHWWRDGRPDLTGWEDCLWCSTVEVLRFGGLDIPASHTEAEDLRAASGEPPLGGSNHNDLVAGMWNRYQVTAISGQGFGSLWLDLVPGTAAVVSGSLAAFPKGHTLRRFLPDYIGGHAIAAFRVDGSYRVWWCDPLAPDGYFGQWVSGDQLNAYMRASDARYTFVRYNQYAPEPDMIITRAPFLGGDRVIRFRAGAKAAGYSTALVETVPERTWTADSAAAARYDVTIEGKRYFWMVTGYYAPNGGSSLVPASDLIEADPDPVLLTEDEVRERVKAGVRLSLNAAVAHVRPTLAAVSVALDEVQMP